MYSLYYLAATMISVGYGDVIPKNYIECQFSIVCMFITGVVYAYSLNSIGLKYSFNHILSEIKIREYNYKYQ